MSRFSIGEQLQQLGLKSTPLRRALLEFFITHHAPVTAETIIQQLNGTALDVSTVYRNLHTFEDAGLIRRVPIRRGVESYEYVGHDDHHHMICVMCGRTEDFKGCGADTFVRSALASSKHFTTITTHVFELYGLCVSCQRKQKHT